ncbi:phosphate/phosphite/phosphonate ABC transporter substrate-binding protein [Allorhizocola rhizosphaerae]|uniref:phosphate/phosphite/phosphonate ABC transporter substrate-binding protein n=1 Tax=Allorhizocola rhizosphaerae TaxID=1872709 RepID=UPI0013C325CA|nr:phosphate/phosphite/phosphonate ABC transporter substrate-binding protein [Allorhizocola rhizosphaerae]
MLAALALVAAVSGCGKETAATTSSGWPEKIIFAAVPAGEANSFQSHYGLFVRALSEEVGIKVETFQAADYAGVIEALISGTVDMAQLGAFSYALAVQNGAKIEPAGLLQHQKGDPPGYTILGIAPASANATGGIDYFRGKTVCFPDPASTSTLLPLFEFEKAGLKLDRDYKRLTVPAGNTIPRTVVKGDCQVGLVADAQLDNAVRTGDVTRDQLTSFWKMQAPHSPVVMRSKLPQDLRDKIRTATLKINAEYLAAKGWCTGDACLISSNRDYGYLPVEHSYYQVIWDACKAAKVEACGPIGK